ncbi:sigma-70 family RNA polymerase sigma factor [Janthinobacterium sp.]|uniref:RNA polymerase sigma factor n=1 Tax=Janthinobacterium sp. TaxID=1871054 RepID=UPI00261A0827|nr:sigma-70 family RNA polymerase sigma factor [Janthinobacterium sp.]
MFGLLRKTTEPPQARPGHGRDESGDLRLISQIVDGDRRAFETLYRAYFSRLARFLDRMTHNTALIEEIVNDVMLVVWRRADTFDRSCKLSTWIFAIAYRTALKAIGHRDEPVDADPDLLHGDAMHEPEATFSQQQLQQRVAQALDLLPLEQRMVLNLTYYHGMAYEEIAGIMECPVNTVKTRMFHARRRLKTLLADTAE